MLRRKRGRIDERTQSRRQLEGSISQSSLQATGPVDKPFKNMLDRQADGSRIWIDSEFPVPAPGIFEGNLLHMGPRLVLCRDIRVWRDINRQEQGWYASQLTSNLGVRIKRLASAPLTVDKTIEKVGSAQNRCSIQLFDVLASSLLDFNPVQQPVRLTLHPRHLEINLQSYFNTKPAGQFLLFFCSLLSNPTNFLHISDVRIT